MERIEQLIQKLPDCADCAMLLDEFNGRYFTGHFFEGVLVLFRKNSAVYYLTDFRYFEMAKSVLNGVEVVLVDDFFCELEKLFRRHGCKKILIETDKITVKMFLKLKSRFAFVDFFTDERLDEIIFNLRAVKTIDELARIKSSQEVTCLAFYHILDFLREGLTEIEIAHEIDRFILERAEGLAFKTIVTSGKNSSLPHGTPTSKSIKAGDFVLMDFGARVDGYCSDMTRVVVVKSFSNFQKEIYDLVLAAQTIALDGVKVGVSCSKLDRVVRDYFKKHGYFKEFGHALGHGVGLKVHEKPTVSKNSSDILKENMVVTLEPGLYLFNKFGVRIEDLVIVKEDGFENLTNCDKNFYIVH